MREALPSLALIVAWSENPETGQRVIGKDGDLPWHLPEDLRFFKKTTMGHAMIMGRKCYASIGRALPGRRSLVLSRNPEFEAPGCEVFPDFDVALAAARETDPCPFVIGGAAIYELAMPLVTRLVVTEVHEVHAGDVYFPRFDEGAFREVERRASDAGLTFRTLER
ncbi:MAG: dihydrofolate reductase [bacterium]|nr:dihydrofolate reductase [bacterium]